MTSIGVQTLLANAVVWSASSASAQFVLAFSDHFNTGVLLSAKDGSIINPNFIDIPAPRGYFGGRKAIEVGSEIWVADLLYDQIWKFDALSGTPKGSILGGTEVDRGSLDGIRGLTQIGNTVYGSLGYSNSQYSAGIVAIDVGTQQVTGNYALPTSQTIYDIIEHEGDLLVSRSIDDDNHVIERYDIAGNFLGIFAQANAGDNFGYPTQMTSTPQGDVLVAWAGGDATGIYAYAPDGTQLGLLAGEGERPYGLALLPSGDIMWNQGEFPGELYLDDAIVQSLGITRMLSPLTIPSPGALVLLGALIGVRQARRRR